MNMLEIKLPSASDSGMLPKINELAIDFEVSANHNEGNGIGLIFSSTSEIRVAGDSEIYNESDVSQGTSMVIAGSQPDTNITKVFFHAGKTRLFVPKDTLIRIETIGVPSGVSIKLVFADFSYSNLFLIRGVGFDFGEKNKFENFNVSGTRTFNVVNSNFEDSFENGNFDKTKLRMLGGVKINNLSNLSEFISMSQINSFDAAGSITSLSGMTNLSYLTLAGNVNGSLEDFLDGMVAAGRTSGTLVVSAVNTNVTYNGTGLVGAKTATFSGSGWTLA